MPSQYLVSNVLLSRQCLIAELICILNQDLVLLSPIDRLMPWGEWQRLAEIGHKLVYAKGSSEIESEHDSTIAASKAQPFEQDPARIARGNVSL
jgi:hypothetical protein